MSSSTASPTLSAAHLLAPITSDMEQVNRVIRQSLASDVLLINQIAEYIIGAGGKRLRPALLLLVAGALAQDDGRYPLCFSLVSGLSSLLSR
jgi:octaprenyl-diphosphate synthase